MCSIHGVSKIEVGLSDFYLVDEIQGIYRGMMIAIPSQKWEIFATFSLDQIAELLLQLATGVNLKRFLKATRGKKKKREPLIVDSKHRHVSTARMTRLTKKINHQFSSNRKNIFINCPLHLIFLTR